MDILAKRFNRTRSEMYRIINDIKPERLIRNILLKTVVELGPKANEGSLIEAVAIPWFQIIKMIEQDPKVMFQIKPLKWEEMVAGWYTQAGFDEVFLTPSSGDFGRDVIAIKKGHISLRIIDQVKAYKPGHLVTANDVRAMAGVLSTDLGATKGVVTTTSDFAPRIHKDPSIAPLFPNRLELVNGNGLQEKLSLLSRPAQSSQLPTIGALDTRIFSRDAHPNQNANAPAGQNATANTKVKRKK